MQDRCSSMPSRSSDLERSVLQRFGERGRLRSNAEGITRGWIRQRPVRRQLPSSAPGVMMRVLRLTLAFAAQPQIRWPDRARNRDGHDCGANHFLRLRPAQIFLVLFVRIVWDLATILRVRLLCV
jgi:hypothetical protein